MKTTKWVKQKLETVQKVNHQTRNRNGNKFNFLFR